MSHDLRGFAANNASGADADASEFVSHHAQLSAVPGLTNTGATHERPTLGLLHWRVVIGHHVLVMAFMSGMCLTIGTASSS